MSLLWNPWVAMGIVAVLAVICAWIESKRKPVHERIGTKGPPPGAILATELNAVVNPEVMTEDDPRASNRRRKQNNTSRKNRRKNRR